MKRLLIVSAEGDAHAERVRDHLGCRNALIWNPLWNADTRYRLTIVNGEPQASIEVTIAGVATELSPSTIKAVWFRRPRSEWPNRHLRSLVYFVAREQDDTLDGVMRVWQSQGVTVVNRQEASFAASNKPRQLLAATAAGFRLPGTVITNDPGAVAQRIVEDGECILKGVSLSGVSIAETHRAIFVKPLTESALRTMSADLPSCPATVQGAVDWMTAIRVVKFKGLTRAFDLPRRGELDWRVFQANTGATVRELSDDVVRKLDELFNSLEIDYGTVDLLEDSAGSIYFLEVNPNGQWLWLEDESGWPLLSEIAAAFMA